ncbi:hypothetical protein ACRFB9_28430 [Klebsiella pneumoniae]
MNSLPQSYLLPFYPILTSIPHKLLLLILIFPPILLLLLLPFTHTTLLTPNTFKLLSKFFFFIFLFNFLLLPQIPPSHLQLPYLLIAQITTFIYFTYFLIILPLISTIQNLLFYIHKLNK